jgi:hypothetical protein
VQDLPDRSESVVHLTAMPSSVVPVLQLRGVRLQMFSELANGTKRKTAEYYST